MEAVTAQKMSHLAERLFLVGVGARAGIRAIAVGVTVGVALVTAGPTTGRAARVVGQGVQREEDAPSARDVRFQCLLWDFELRGRAEFKVF
jgi:hypothetical protein